MNTTRQARRTRAREKAKRMISKDRKVCTENRRIRRALGKQLACKLAASR